MNKDASLKLPGPEYQIELDFDAPLDYVYEWCTDFSPEDGKLEGQKYVRRIISRTNRRVVYEDLEEEKDGYVWVHNEVTLQPPNRWRVDSFGSHRSVRADYRLSSIAPDRTMFEMRWRRLATPLAKVKMTRAQREKATRKDWEHFKRALQLDYRRSKRSSR
jgi:hypothetical protein